MISIGVQLDADHLRDLEFVQQAYRNRSECLRDLIQRAARRQRLRPVRGMFTAVGHSVTVNLEVRHDRTD